MRDHISGILKSLPVREDRIGDVGLWAFRIVGAAVLWGTQDIPRARTGGTAKAQRALVDFHNRMIDAAEHINTMPREAHEAMPGALAEIERFLAIAEAARAAHDKLADGSPSRAGRPSKEAAAAVAREAASAFKTLTGKRPTVISATDTTVNDSGGGPFVDMVAQIFDTLRIDASAESQARAAVKKMRSNA